MNNWFVDTETCGFVGPAVLIQYAINDGPIHLHSIWSNPVRETKKLIEEMLQNNIILFNTTFDAFHIQKIYNMISILDDDEYPEDHIDYLAENEARCRDGLCLKPQSTCDLMLVGRKGKMQKTMNRKPIRIKKVPAALAGRLAIELVERIELDDILFARRKKKLDNVWQVLDREDDPHFKDIVLKFCPSMSLKALAEYVGLTGEGKAIYFDQANVDSKFQPKENGFAPFATSVGNKDNRWNGAWPYVIREHIAHWGYNSIARTYAEDDVRYTRGLWEYFEKPEGNDDDSVLAWQIGACRWKGYKVDSTRLKVLHEKYTTIADSAPKSPSATLRVLEPHLSELEKEALKNEKGNLSTKKEVLETISKWENHPAAEVAKAVIKARQATKRVEVIDKLLLAGRMHPDFKVIGAKSGRMSGSGGLNAQGIPHEAAFRECFPLALDGMVLSGGDFDAFEVTILDAAFPDPELHKELQSGVKIHTLMAEQLFKPATREEILASKNTENDLYAKGKTGTFAITYLSTAHTVSQNLGIPEEVAEAALNGFRSRFSGMAMGQAKVIQSFTAMSQKGGIGSAIVWEDPKDFSETLLGFKRNFELEVQCMKALFHLAQNPPPTWRQLKIRVQRRDRMQTASGATQSALYACAFGIQGQVIRAGNNHIIQGTGAQITKRTQRRIWDLQPVGISEWLVMPMNVHDEVLAPNSIPDKVAAVVDETVKQYRTTVPLVKIGWAKDIPTWNDTH